MSAARLPERPGRETQMRSCRRRRPRDRKRGIAEQCRRPSRGDRFPSRACRRKGSRLAVGGACRRRAGLPPRCRLSSARRRKRGSPDGVQDPADTHATAGAPSTRSHKSFVADAMARSDDRPSEDERSRQHGPVVDARSTPIRVMAASWLLRTTSSGGIVAELATPFRAKRSRTPPSRRHPLPSKPITASSAPGRSLLGGAIAPPAGDRSSEKMT